GGSGVAWVGLGRPHAANLWIKSDQKVFCGFGQINRDEQAFEVHRTSEPARASSPAAPTEDGRRLFTIFIACAVIFGKSALAMINARAGSGITKAGRPRAHAARIFLAARSAEIEANGNLFARVKDSNSAA